MKKEIAAAWMLVSILFLSVTSQGDQTWQKYLDLNLTATQNSYSDNWTGGEAGNVSWVANANSGFEKQLSEKLNSKTTIKLAFGQTHAQDQETKRWAKPTKSTDLIDIETLARLTLHTWMDPYAAVRFESQFLDASYPALKRYVNPKKITESGGISKQFHKTEKNEILSRLGLALRQIIKEDIVFLSPIGDVIYGID